MIAVEGPVRDAMRATGCEPSCHACGRRLAVGEHGDFVPTVTIYDPLWKGGEKKLEAFVCEGCVAAGRQARADDVLDSLDYVLDQGVFFEWTKRLGLDRSDVILRVFAGTGIVVIEAPKARPHDGPGAWVGAAQQLHAVWLNGGLFWLDYDTMAQAAPDEVRAAWQRAVGRREE